MRNPAALVGSNRALQRRGELVRVSPSGGNRRGWSALAVRRIVRASYAVLMLACIGSPSSWGHVLGDGFLFMATEGVSAMIRAELPLPSVVEATGIESLEETSLDRHFEAIETYVAPRIGVTSGRRDMPIVVESLTMTSTPLGEFLIVSFRPYEFDAAVETVRVEYRLFFENDLEHRGILVIQDVAEYAESSEAGTVVAIFTPDTREQSVQILSPAAIEYGRAAEPGTLVRLLALLAPALAAGALVALFATWGVSKRRARSRGAGAGGGRRGRFEVGVFLVALGTTLVLAGSTFLSAGVLPLRGEYWVPAQVPFDRGAPSSAEIEFRAGMDAVYEVEVLERAPRAGDARRAVVEVRKRQGYPQVEWSVRNPHGRVAAGNGARPSYVTANSVGLGKRLFQMLMASPLLPDAKLSLSRRKYRERWVVSGIGQWRARAGQTYWLSVAQADAATAPAETISVRFRLRRQSWNALFRRHEMLVQGGLLATLLGALLFASGWVFRRRQTAAAA